MRTRRAARAGLKRDAPSEPNPTRREGHETLRVEGAHRFGEFGGHEPCVDGRALNILVAQVLLNGSEIPRSPQQLDRVRVSERVRMQFLDTGALSEIAHELPDTTATHPLHDHLPRDGGIADEEQRLGGGRVRAIGLR